MHGHLAFVVFVFLLFLVVVDDAGTHERGCDLARYAGCHRLGQIEGQLPHWKVSGFELSSFA